jgi:hypothetical protein
MAQRLGFGLVCISWKWSANSAFVSISITNSRCMVCQHSLRIRSLPHTWSPPPATNAKSQTTSTHDPHPLLVHGHNSTIPVCERRSMLTDGSDVQTTNLVFRSSVVHGHMRCYLWSIGITDKLLILSAYSKTVPVGGSHLLVRACESVVWRLRDIVGVCTWCRRWCVITYVVYWPNKYCRNCTVLCTVH